MDISDDTRVGLLEFAEAGGDLNFDDDHRQESAERVTRMLQLIVSSVDYQFE
jgi:hypothetical protein